MDMVLTLVLLASLVFEVVLLMDKDKLKKNNEKLREATKQLKEINECSLDDLEQACLIGLKTEKYIEKLNKLSQEKNKIIAGKIIDLKEEEELHKIWKAIATAEMKRNYKETKPKKVIRGMRGYRYAKRKNSIGAKRLRQEVGLAFQIGYDTAAFID